MIKEIDNTMIKDIENQIELVIKDNNIINKIITDEELIKKINDVKHISDELLEKIEKIEKRLRRKNQYEATIYDTLYFLFKIVLLIIVVIITLLLIRNNINNNK